MWPALCGNIIIEIFFGILLGLKWWKHALTVCSKGHLSIDWIGSLHRRWKLTSKSFSETALYLLFWAPNCVPRSAKICLLKKSLSICQFGWREIWNAFPASNLLCLLGGPVSSTAALPYLYFPWSKNAEACFVFRTRGIVWAECFVLQDFTEHACLESYWPSPWGPVQVYRRPGGGGGTWVFFWWVCTARDFPPPHPASYHTG